MKILLEQTPITPTRIFCIGRNYVQHVRELSDQMPDAPVIFMKPYTSLLPEGETLVPPTHGRDFHYETELVVLIGKEGRVTQPEDAKGAIAGLSLGLDLTMRDVQSELLPKGLPWELCKAFDGSAPVGRFTPIEKFPHLDQIRYSCDINGERRQEGDTQFMIFPIPELLIAISRAWKLIPGDLIYTGTPAGIGALASGDRITLTNEVMGEFQWSVA